METHAQNLRLFLSAALVFAYPIYADTNKTHMAVSVTVMSGCTINTPSTTITLGTRPQLSCSTGSQPSVYNMPVQLISTTVNSFIEADQLVIVTVIDF